MRRRSWRIASACEIGTSHLKSGLPCQDSIAHSIVRTKRGNVVVTVVCDGAGSAAHSEIGSWLAANTFVELVEVYLKTGGLVADIDRARVVSWVEATRASLTQRAHSDGNSPKDYACTLIAAIVGPSAAAFAQIGDGAIVVSHGEADGWSWVFWPQHGEYANQTTFVLSANATSVLEFGLAPRRIDEFAMFSDGIERMVLHTATKSVNNDFFEQMLRPVRVSNSWGVDQKLSSGLKAYLGSAPVNARTDDDKSLVMATRRPMKRVVRIK
ncbi:PP2C family serine/threonine-protein phosphatase [Bradyrhizobium tunisiense]|uniref:PP2C family serine/threonine-protein phosphatase n=1 Tax=Bradyrhizobium tunisiense TaxID=3278709 RepID=UPI0035DF7C42